MNLSLSAFLINPIWYTAKISIVPSSKGNMTGTTLTLVVGSITSQALTNTVINANGDGNSYVLAYLAFSGPYYST